MEREGNVLPVKARRVKAVGAPDMDATATNHRPPMVSVQPTLAVWVPVVMDALVDWYMVGHIIARRYSAVRSAPLAGPVSETAICAASSAASR